MRSALAGWIVEMLSGHHSRQSSGKDLVAPASSGHVLVPLGRNRRETIRTQKCSWHMLKRSEEHTSELQSLMRISYAVFCLKKKNILSVDMPITETRTHNNYSSKQQRYSPKALL